MKELTVIFFSSWKFALTFPMAIFTLDMSPAEVLLYTNIGGLTGLILFTFLSQQILLLHRTYIAPLIPTKQAKLVFTKKRRRFVFLKNKYGFPGIVFLNPILISIPISTFLVIKYYGIKKRLIIWLLIGQFMWSLLYILFYFVIKPILL